MSYKQEKSVIPIEFKQLTCQAVNCVHNKGPACSHEWMELDETGRCIFLSIERVVTHPITKEKHTVGY